MHDRGHASAACAPRAVRMYGQLMRRSSIIGGRPRRFGRRACAPSRGQLSATVMSCVTMTTVVPSRACRSRIERENLRAGLRVEISGRLVAEQDRRIDRERAGDRHPLPLAAGELVGQMLDARRRGRPARAARARARRAFVRGQRRRCSGSATFCSAVRLGSRLKNWKMKPILSRRIARPLVVVERRREPAPSIALRPVVGLIERAHHVQQRRLAGPRGADDRHHFAALDLEVDGSRR